MPTTKQRNNLLRTDPTRTGLMRKAFSKKLDQQWKRLALRIHNLVAKENAFGLTINRSYSYCSTQINITDPELLRLIDDYKKTIDPDDVIRWEETPHVTVRYGLHPSGEELAEKVQQFIRDTGPITLHIGKPSVFQTPEADVLKLDIDSPKLHQLNKLLTVFPHTDTHPKYVPHLTIAYLKVGAGDRYTLQSSPEIVGREFTATEFVFSNQEGEHESITLNVFCATGEGGGVDPTCNTGGEDNSHLTHKVHPDDPTYKLKGEKPKDVYHGTTLAGGLRALGFGLQPPKTGASVEGHVYTVDKPEKAHTYAQGISFGNDFGGYSVVKAEMPKKVWEKTSLDPEEHGTNTDEIKRTVNGPEGRAFKTQKSIPLSAIQEVEFFADVEDRTPFFVFKKGMDPVKAYDEIHRLSRGKLKNGKNVIVGNEYIENAGQWGSLTSEEKLREFKEWLREQFGDTVSGDDERALWDAYVESGFRRGAGRSYDDVGRVGKLLRSGLPVSLTESKDSFLRISLNRPETIEKVKLLAARTFEELDGLNATMVTQLGRTLVDGLVTGQHPKEIARTLDGQLQLGRDRADLIAQTEIIRAHAEGQLTSLEQLGVDEVGVAVEWSTAGDGHVCPLCKPLQGIVLKISEARGMIPRHPRCRCAFTPANVGEDTDGQKRSPASIRDAIKQSRTKGKDAKKWGPNKPIGKQRPKSVLTGNRLTQYQYMVENVFCPTGKGGGIDPTCDKVESDSNHPIALGPTSDEKYARTKINNLTDVAKSRSNGSKVLHPDEVDTYVKQFTGPTADVIGEAGVKSLDLLKRSSALARYNRETNKPHRPDLYAANAEIDKMILASKSTKEPLTVFRAVDVQSVQDSYKVGHVITDTAHQSTSVSPTYAETTLGGNFKENTMIQIRLPKGTKAVYTGNVTPDYEHEKELVLPRGGGYKVVSVEDMGKGKYVVVDWIAPAGH